ncbi:hypothetical protein [Streptomyces sp. BA2]|uniref:hypothetical protein n=1 Tax=Streptomyces sp. BA2 TaxID=436595 RepID=UPI003014B545
MIVLLALLVVALFGLGFLNAMWWVAAAVLIFAVVHYGRGGLGARAEAVIPSTATIGTAGTGRTAGTAATGASAGGAGCARAAATANIAGDLRAGLVVAAPYVM